MSTKEENINIQRKAFFLKPLAPLRKGENPNTYIQNRLSEIEDKNFVSVYNNNNYSVEATREAVNRPRKPLTEAEKYERKGQGVINFLKKQIEEEESKPFTLINQLFIGRNRFNKLRENKIQNLEQQIHNKQKEIKEYLEEEKRNKEYYKQRKNYARKLGFKSEKEMIAANYEAKQMGYRNIEEKVEKNKEAKGLGFQNNLDKIRYIREHLFELVEQKELINKNQEEIEGYVFSELKSLLAQNEYEALQKEYNNFKETIDIWRHFSSLEDVKKYEEKILYLKQQGKSNTNLKKSIPKYYPDITILRDLFYDMYIDKEKRGDGRYSNYYAQGLKGYLKKFAVILVPNIDKFIYSAAITATKYNFTNEQKRNFNVQYLINYIKAARKELNLNSLSQTRRNSTATTKSKNVSHTRRSRAPSNVSYASNPRSLAPSPIPSQFTGINNH